MNNLSTKFTDKDFNLIKSIVGKRISKIVHDEFIYTNTTFGHINIFTDDKIFELKCKLESLSYYGEVDDVAVLGFNEVSHNEVKSELEDVKQTETYINDILLSVDIVNEHQYVKTGKDEYNFDFTRGIILHFKDLDYAFVMSAWFSEIIEIYKGKGLVGKFNKDESFNEAFNKVSEKKIERTITAI